MSHGICRMWAVWIALLLWAAPTQGVTTNCVIPAVERFQNTSLTCTFSDDISNLKQDFKVQFYKSNTTDSTEVILDCFWVNDKPECTVHKCCEYDYHVNETLTLRVLNVTETRVGRYVCFVLPAAPDSYNFCNFTLKEKHHTDTSESSLAALAVLVIIPVIICIIIIIIIVWRRQRSQKTGGNTTEKKPCQFWQGKWCSGKEKPDDESKQPLNKDEVNDGNKSINVPDSIDRRTDEDVDSTVPKTAEKLGQKSDNTDGSHGPVHTSIIGRMRTWIDNFFRREPVNRNAELRCTPPQEPSIMKNEGPSTSVTGLQTKPEEIENGQTDVTNDNALNKPALSESGINVSKSGINATVTESQKMQSPSDQNAVISPIAEQSSDHGTGTTRETIRTLRENELEIESEIKEQKTQKSDVYNYTTDISKEGKLAEHVIMKAMKKDKVAQEKSENDQRIAKDKAQKEIQNAREKAEKEEKLVKENAEKDETIAKEKAEKREKIAKEKAEKEERIADDKAKEEEKIAKDKAEKEEKIAKQTSKTTASIEEQVKKISNEKEEQMKKIAKRKEEQMEVIAKEKEEQLEKIAKEKRDELEKIANMKEKELQEISKRKVVEIEEIRKKTEEEMERIAKEKEEQLKEISKKKEDKMEKIRKENEKQLEAKTKKKEKEKTKKKEKEKTKKKEKEKTKKKEKENESIKRKEERQSKKKGKGKKQANIRESDEGQGSDKQSKEKESEDDVCRVELADEADPLLTTKNSNDQVNIATRTTDTVIIMSELASHQDTSEAPTGKQDQTLQVVDKVGNPVKQTNNEDIESNGKETKTSRCAVS